MISIRPACRIKFLRGLKLHRRNFGELVENGAGAYHWMKGNFLKYAGPHNWNDMPVNFHELLALCAPRPVFTSVGSPKVEGGWVDAKGMFPAGVGAGPVYQLESHEQKAPGSLWRKQD